MFSAFSILFLNIGVAIIYYMSEDLLKKREKDQGFKNEVKKNEERYSALEQASQYSQTNSVPAGILKKISGPRQVFFYFGYQQPTLKKDMCQVAMYLIKNFHPNTNYPYTLVFFNDKCSDNYVLWNFRETFSYLKLEQIAAIQQFIVVKPFFYHKTMDWMTFGTIPKFIRSRTKFIYSCKELCDYLKIDIHQFIDQVPAYLHEKQFAEFQAQKTSLEILRMNIKGQERSQQENNTMMQFQKTIKSMIMKPGYEINNIQDYEIGAEGVPIILKMLVFYFDSHQEGLQLEGIFRKSVSVDEENQTILKILTKNYDHLLEVENPHIIANLIKRFFSSLKNPIFSFPQFTQLMNDQGVKDKTQHLKTIFQSLPELNKRTLLFIFTFFKQKVLKMEHHNKMSSQNISICFAPCIFRSEFPSVADLIYATKGVMYCKIFISQFEQIFGSQEEREVLYRNSYMESKKNFEQCLDIGIELAIEIAQQNQQDIKSSKRVSHQFNEEVNDLKFVDIELEEQTNEKVEQPEKPEVKQAEEPQKQQEQPKTQVIVKDAVSPSQQQQTQIIVIEPETYEFEGEQNKDTTPQNFI